jgi:hypothetical protein
LLLGGWAQRKNFEEAAEQLRARARRSRAAAPVACVGYARWLRAATMCFCLMAVAARRLLHNNQLSPAHSFFVSTVVLDNSGSQRPGGLNFASPSSRSVLRQHAHVD